MTTEAAQRRLLEALAELNKTPGGIAGMQLGLPGAVEFARASGVPALAVVWEAFSELAAAVEADLSSGVSSG